MAFAGWAAAELVHGLAQSVVLWAARAECPPCTCTPTLVCAPGQEALPGVCPSPTGTWPLSAVLLALVVGAVVGLVAAQVLGRQPPPAAAPLGIGTDELARTQAAQVRAAQALRQAQ